MRRAREEYRVRYATTNEIITLMAQLGDPTHLTKKDAAWVLSQVRDHDASLRTLERMIARKELVLEQIPQRYGIRIESIY